MKARFIKLNCIEPTEDGMVVLNAENISTIRRIDYNGTVQTMIQMIGGERFGVAETVDELMALAEEAETASA